MSYEDDDGLDRLLGIPNARLQAEHHLLELVRGQAADEFMLTITCSNGRWSVVTDGWLPPGRALGEGQSFAEAWHRQDPTMPQGDNDDNDPVTHQPS